MYYNEFDGQNKNKNERRKIYRIVYVESYFKVREPISKNLIMPHTKYSFDVIPKASNLQVIPELLKNKIDLVILDVDQILDDFLAITNQIRSFVWYMPIVFASADKERAVHVVNNIISTDRRFSEAIRRKFKISSLIDDKIENQGLDNVDVIQIGPYLIPADLIMNREIQIKCLVYPVIDENIYYPSDKFSLVTSVAAIKLNKLIKRSMQIKEKLEKYFNKSEEEKN
jgi:DNA-binding NarL/FixJ family response regulator